MSRQVMSSKVKVDTAKLLAGVKDYLARCAKEHDKRVVAYEKSVVGYRAAVVKALEAALADARAGRDLPTRYKAIEVPCAVDRPTEPVLDTSQIDRLIKTLEMASDESIAISADDAAYYLG